MQFCFEYMVSGSIEARLEPSPIAAIAGKEALLAKTVMTV
jgi:hypothetical protein